MIRNLKVLGVAVVAVLALGAVVASSAMAQQGKLTSTGPVTLTGTNTPEKVNKLSAFGLETKCPNVKYTGHKAEVTPHEAIPVPATQVTITPHYGVCETPDPIFGGVFPTTVDMNGCDYTFDLGETTGGLAGTYGVTATLHCNPETNHIKITVFTKNKPHTTENHFCTITITQRTTYTGLHATDTGGGSIRITGTLTGISAHKETNEWDKNSIACSKQSEEAATLTLDVTVTGDNAEGKATTISLSE